MNYTSVLFGMLVYGSISVTGRETSSVLVSGRFDPEADNIRSLKTESDTRMRDPFANYGSHHSRCLCLDSIKVTPEVVIDLLIGHV
jgi:hypothetical protein